MRLGDVWSNFSRIFMKKLLLSSTSPAPVFRLFIPVVGFLLVVWSAGILQGQTARETVLPGHIKRTVNQAWLPIARGAEVQPGVVLGQNAFATLQEAIDAARPGDRIEVAPGFYRGVRIGKNLDLVANDAGVIVQGHSPALVYTSGSNTFTGFTFVTGTDDPSILVTGGFLRLRDCTIIESANFDQTAIQITSGTVDLGTASSPGGNTIRVSGDGSFINNTSPDTVMALGNTWQQDATDVTDNYQIEDGIFHALDVGGSGPVFYVADNVYVTQNSGSIQRGIDAITAGGTVNVDAITLVEGPQIVVNKDVTVSGQGVNNTILQAGGDTTAPGDARGWWVVESCHNFELFDVTLDGNGHQIYEAIRHHGTGQIAGVYFTQIAAPDYSGVAIHALGGCGEVEVSNCAFDNIGRAGLQLSGADTAAIFENNTYTGKGAGDWLDFAVEVETGASVVVQLGNQITGNQGVSSVDGTISAGVLVSSASAPASTADISQNNVFTGNTIGVQAGLGATDVSQVRLQDNDLTGNTQAGLAVTGGATVDAGDCSASDVTGLGASNGGNNLSGYGFDNMAPWAIENSNPAAGAIVLAQNNTFGAGGPGAHIEDVLLDDTDDAGLSAVHASQPTLAITCPAPTTVQCASEIPLAATSLESFALAGGAASSTPATVSHLDSPLPSGNGVVTRTYTLVDDCANSVDCEQAITLDDTTPPIIGTCPTDRTISVGANCDVSLLDLVGEVVATDNCGGAVTVSQSPAPATSVGLGTTVVTMSATDVAGNVSTCTVNVTAEDTTPPSITTCAPDRTLSVGSSCDVALPDLTGDVLTADNCPGSVAVMQSPAAGTMVGLGATVVTLTATDAAGNTATCTATVTAEDTTAPTFTCPGDMTVNTDPGVCSAVVSFIATATDNCGSPTVACTPASGSVFAKGTTTLNCTATDAANNTTSCSFNVTVNDTEAPVVTCPADIAVNTDPGECSAVVTFAATATDNCPDVTVGCVPPSGSAFSKGENPVTCTATDAAGNTGSCSFTITVDDAEAPVITCPTDLTVSTDAGQCSAVVNFDAPATDNCPGVGVICTPPSGFAFEKGVTAVNCVATDAGGLTASCSFTVTVEDTEPPVVNCPADMVVRAPEGQCDRVVNFTVSATDNCPGVSAVVCNPPSGSVFANGAITVNCSATDAGALSGSCSFTVTVFDREPPQITFCPADITVECDTPLTPVNTGGSATATDTCDPAPVLTYTDAAPLAVTPTDLDGWIFVVQGFPVTASAEMSAGPGTPPLGTGSFHASVGANGENLAEMRNYLYDQVALSALTELSYSTYRTTDGAGLNREIYIILNIDTDGNGSGDDVLYFEPRYQNGSNPGLPLQGATLTGAWQRWDARAGGWWSLNHPEIMYPGAGVKALATYISSFPDAQIVNGLSGGGVRLVAGGGAGVWNGFDGNADYLVIGTNGISTAFNFDTTDNSTCPTVTIRTWTAADLGGNAISCSQKLVKADTTPPALTCPADKSVECTAAWDFEEPTAMDHCGPATISLVGTVTNMTCGSTYEAVRTWEAIDDCGNISQCSQTVTVQDTVAPSVTCPADVTLECDQPREPGDIGMATATDTCDIAPVITFIDAAASGSCPQTPIITRTWTATDACGNASSCEQIITLIDTTPPEVTCAPAKTVECGESWDFDLPVATDTCGTVIITALSTTTNVNGACGDTFMATRLWEISDGCGNTVECTQEVTVQDTTAPMIECAGEKTVECGMAWKFDAPVYSDECVFDSLVYDNSQNDLRYRFDIGTTEVGDEIILEGTSRQVTRFVFEYWGLNSEQATFAGEVTARVRFYRNDGADFNGYPTPGTMIYDSGPFAVPATDRSTVTIEDFQIDAVMPLVGDLPESFTWTVQFDGLAANDSAGLDLYSPAVVGQNYPDFWQLTGTDWELKTNPLVSVDFAARIDAARTNVLVTVINTETNAVGACGQTFTATRTWEAVDPCGNASQCSQIVTVTDTTGPALVCPLDVVVECDEATDPSATGMADATDPCDENPTIAFTDAVAPGTCAQEQIITRTWSATDACGNTSSCAQLITVADTTPPVVSCPDDVTVECDELTNPDATGTANSTDVCDPNPTLTFTDAAAPGSCAQAQVITRTWTATDACGNSSSCDQVITLTDMTPPVVSCPADVTVECNSPTDPSATGTGTATDNCDANPGVSFSDAIAAGSCPQGQVITRTWTATDACGNASSCDQIITVADTAAPVVTCPANVTVECGEPTDPSATGDGSAVDGCDPSVTVSFTDVTTPGVCPSAQIITRTWTATDDCGNTGTCDQTITVTDSTPPTITCPASLTVTSANGACEQAVEFTPTAADACGTVTVECVPPSGSAFPIGTTSVTCTATDDCGNSSSCMFEVTVEPISFAQTVNLPIPDNNPDGLTNTMTITTDINALTDLAVTLRISHSWNGDLYAFLVHESGYAVLLNRVGRGMDDSFDLLGYGDNGFDVTLADDASQGDVHIYRLTLFDDNDTPLTGPLTGIWAPDGRDVDPSAAQNTDPRTALLAAFQGLDPNGDWTLVVADLQAGDTGILQSWSLRMCGEVGVPPEITGQPQDTTVECGSEATLTVTAAGEGLAYQWFFGATPIPGADGETLTLTDVHPADGGGYAVVITNEAGSVTSETATLTVVDTTKPEMTCPANLVFTTDPGQCDKSNVAYGVTAVDACGTVTIECVPPEGSTLPQGVTSVTCTATDEANNVSSCTFDVTVNDGELPAISCPGDLTVGNDPGECSATVTFNVTANDNCPGVIVVCVPPSGSSFDQGTTPVTCTATDSSGNAVDCTFNVTVSDTEGPSVCMDAPSFELAGDIDDFVGPEPASPRASLLTYLDGTAVVKGFDDATADQWLAHTFAGLPAKLSSARLLLKVRASSAPSVDDAISLVFSQPNGTLRTGTMGPALWRLRLRPGLARGHGVDNRNHPGIRTRPVAFAERRRELH